jgi:hypothetical protein
MQVCWGLPAVDSGTVPSGSRTGPGMRARRGDWITTVRASAGPRTLVWASTLSPCALPALGTPASWTQERVLEILTRSLYRVAILHPDTEALEPFHWPDAGQTVPVRRRSKPRPPVRRPGSVAHDAFRRERRFRGPPPLRPAEPQDGPVSALHQTGRFVGASPVIGQALTLELAQANARAAVPAGRLCHWL